MRHLLMLVTIVGLVTVGCGDRRQSATSEQPSAGLKPSQQASSPQEAIIPGDVSYSIINSSTFRDQFTNERIKRSVDVRLNKKVSEQTLRAIALKLRAYESPPGYKRTFITYYLPGMDVGAGAWATTHFNPELEVRILGLTTEEEEKLVAEPAPANREIIGRWLDEGPFVSGRITIFREEGKLFMERMLKDGSSFKEELVEKDSPLGRRFDQVEDSGAGDHLVIRPDGKLQLRDNEGLIATAKAIE